MSAQKVLVFGATGAVGGAAALEAHNRGAEVHLAMRDPSKPTPTLPDLPKHKADLTDPASIENAVKESGASAVFCYVTWGKSFKPTAEALKKAGIKHVVLLSSYSVYPDREKQAAKNPIAKTHVEAEMALEEAGLTASYIRPMYFSSNIWHSKQGIQAGSIPVFCPNAVNDYIAPEDIGSVAGSKLVTGNPEHIPLCGPALVSQQEAWKIVGEELGKDIKTPEVSKEEYIKILEKGGMPGFIANVVAGLFELPTEEKYESGTWEQASANVKKYTGREPIGLREWVRKHKAEADEPSHH